MLRKTFIFIFSFGLFCACEPDDFSPFGGRGTVIDAETGLGLDSVIVKLQPGPMTVSNRATIQSQMTSSQGHFRFQAGDDNFHRSSIVLSRPPYYHPQTYDLQPDGHMYRMHPTAVLKFAILRPQGYDPDVLVSAELLNAQYQPAGYSIPYWQSSANAHYKTLAGERPYYMRIRTYISPDSILAADTIAFSIPYRDTLELLHINDF